MTQNIKKFIEDNIELLDSDLVEFFVITYEQGKLDRADVAYMSSLLSDAGIQDVDMYRDQALLKILDYNISEWAIADGGVSSMPVYDFIEVFLDNCVGFDENYVLLFIKKHSDRWDNYAEIYIENNMTIISRR